MLRQASNSAQQCSVVCAQKAGLTQSGGSGCDRDSVKICQYQLDWCESWYSGNFEKDSSKKTIYITCCAFKHKMPKEMSSFQQWIPLYYPCVKKLWPQSLGEPLAIYMRSHLPLSTGWLWVLGQSPGSSTLRCPWDLNIWKFPFPQIMDV